MQLGSENFRNTQCVKYCYHLAARYLLTSESSETTIRLSQHVGKNEDRASIKTCVMPLGKEKSNTLYCHTLTALKTVMEGQATDCL